MIAGNASVKDGETNISPHNIVYLPKTGDLVVGLVTTARNNMWIVDINGPFEAILPASHVPWKAVYGQTNAQMPPGSTIVGRLLEVDETMRCVLTMKGVGMRRLSSGTVVDVKLSSIGKIIGQGGTMLKRLKNKSGCRILLGENGRIWIDGEVPSMQWLRSVILAINAGIEQDSVNELFEKMP